MADRAIDPRLRAAIDASIGWYEDLFALHGVGSRIDGGLWRALGPPPPLHADAVVVEPNVMAAAVARALEDRLHASVKDSFATVDMSSHGMELLFAATWIHRPAAVEAADGPWRRITTASELATWTAGHDTADVLLPPLLERAHFAILARFEGEEIVAGAVARLGSGTVDLSNVHAAPGHEVDWEELVAAVAVHFPGRPLVGYERGDDLAAAIAGGFEPVGDLRVWVR